MILTALQRHCAIKMKLSCYGRWFMVFNDPFSKLSVISWRSVLFVKETGVQGENHRPVASHRQTLSHNVVLSTSKKNCYTKIKICRKIIFVKMTYELSYDNLKSKIYDHAYDFL